MIKKLTAFLAFVLCICLAMPVYPVKAENLDENNVESSDALNISSQSMVDIVFVIDTTGSMGSVITDVKKNIKDFMNSIWNGNIDVRVRFISYRDCSYTDRESEKTTCSEKWFGANEDTEAIAYLESLKASGGGDEPETLLDGIGTMLDWTDWRDNAARFCVILTDASYKIDNTHSYGTAESVIDKMVEKGIHTSVFTRTALYPYYAAFVTNPTIDSVEDGGILADITEDFSILLKDMADKVICVVGQEDAVKVKASMIVLKKQEGCTYRCAKNELDESGNLTWGEKQASCVFKDLQPSTKYVFEVYNSIDAKVAIYYLETESSTGARFSSIPSIVYEGEVYNIKPDGAMKNMIVTSGATITWSCDSDCVKITKDTVGEGCQVVIRDCEYNDEKLIKVTLNAYIRYSVKNKNGTYSIKNKTFKKKFSLLNEIDAIEVGGVRETSNNVYQDGIIILRDKEKVSLDIVLNQGVDGDTPSKRKLTYIISDQYGFKNSYGKTIAKVNAKGEVWGVNPGVTYVTVGPKEEYNKYGNTFNYSVTIPIICPHVDSVKFNVVEQGTLNADKTALIMVNDSRIEDEPDYVVPVKVGDVLDLNARLVFNPSGVFNQENMQKSWISVDPSIGKVSIRGKVTFKRTGYVTIFMVPIGGYEINAKTGGYKISAKPCSITFKVTD